MSISVQYGRSFVWGVPAFNERKRIVNLPHGRVRISFRQKQFARMFVRCYYENAAGPVTITGRYLLEDKDGVWIPVQTAENWRLIVT